MSEQERKGLLPITAEIVAAYVRNNRARPEELVTLIGEVHETFERAAAGGPAPGGGDDRDRAQQRPAVSVKRSVTPDYIISLEDGRKFRSLTRHLMAQYGLTPTEYRIKWNLPPDYPMVAPNYSEKRSRIARQARREQLGQSGGKGTPPKR